MFPRPDGVGTGVAAAEDVRIYGLTAGGVASELDRFDDRHPSSTRALIDGDTRIPVDPEAVVGGLDLLVGLDVTYALDPPDDASHHDWLEVTMAGPLVDDRFTVEDPARGSGHAIRFGTLPDGGQRSVQVMVGACPQWKAYDPAEPLLLRSREGVTVKRVRLVR